MKLAENTRVVYDDILHTYTLDSGADNERLLPGVTQLMKLHGISTDYSTPPPGTNYTQEQWEEIRDHAATLGTMAHEAIQAYAMGEPVDDTPLVRSFAALALNVVAVEYLVSDNDNVASKIDAVAEVEDGVFDLYDFKRTGQLHMDDLAWQLGFYKYLFLLQNPGAKVRYCFGLLINKGNKDNILEDTVNRPRIVTVQPDTEVLRLLEFNRSGLKYQAEVVEDLIAIQDLGSLVKYHAEIAAAKEALKQMTDAYDKLMDTIKASMEAAGKSELETPSGVFKIKAGYDRESVDTKQLKVKYPEIANELLKVTTTKSSISFKPYGD